MTVTSTELASPNVDSTKCEKNTSRLEVKPSDAAQAGALCLSLSLGHVQLSPIERKVQGAPPIYGHWTLHKTAKLCTNHLLALDLE